LVDKSPALPGFFYCQRAGISHFFRKHAPGTLLRLKIPITNYGKKRKNNHEIEPPVRRIRRKGYIERRFFFPSSTFANAIRLCG
jgi:hypothetical protein